MSKVVLAYSGGLDTTICVHYLKNVKGMKVYTFSANLGQMEYLEPLVEKAMELGAHAAHIADLRSDFVTEFIFPCIRARAMYESKYYLFSALSRPLIIRELVKIAKEEGCDYIAHGSRGIGNDSIRFQNALSALDPSLNMVSPLEELKLETPQQDMQYASKHQIKVEDIKKTVYNIEQNLWGVNIQIRDHAQVWNEPGSETYITTLPISETPIKPTIITLEFKHGVPIKLNGDQLPPVELVNQLSKIGGRNGCGRISTIENRLNNVKTREIYEAPAATIIYKALDDLESVVIDKETLHFKQIPSEKYSSLVYEGKWFIPLRAALDKFFQDMLKKATGKVTLELFKGNLRTTKIESPNSLL